MKHKTLLVIVISVVVVIAGVAGAAAQGPRPLGALHVSTIAGTGFTYQGQLKSGNVPVSATCPFNFKLFDAASGGTQIGGTIPQSIPVSNGLFTTVLDFGTGAFTGDARWLDIQVKCPGDDVYSFLTPRQPITPAPMALALPGLWTQPNATSPNLIGGFSGNVISPTLFGATIGGGGTSGSINRITNSGNYATIGGGQNNRATNFAATVGGGQYNTASNQEATVGGGGSNTASQLEATVSGGGSNTASQFAATVGGGTSNTASNIGATVSGGGSNTASELEATVSGGDSNQASGTGATVPGGESNAASGPFSFAAGHHANTNLQNGTFVWADDSVTTEISATAPNQFLIRAKGGVGINTNAPSASLTVVSAKNTAVDNTATFFNGALGPYYSHIQYGVTGDWYIRSSSASGKVILQDTGGNVGIGTASPNIAYKLDIVGAVRASGGFNGQCLTNGSNTFNTNTNRACNMDVAEAFATTDRTEPGDVVALVAQPAGSKSPAAGPTVSKASRADGSLVVGVVSSNPGLVFDNGQTHLAGDNSQLITADRTVVALVGRVPVKVSLENGSIAVGDPLTSGSVAGFAMKATQAGQILGYALQSSDELSEGKLLAWLQPGLYVPPAQVARLNASSTEADSASLSVQVAQLQARNAAMAEQNASVEARVTAVTQQNTALEARMAALEQALQSGSAAAHAADGGIPTTWLLFGGVLVLGVVALRRRA